VPSTSPADLSSDRRPRVPGVERTRCLRLNLRTTVPFAGDQRFGTAVVSFEKLPH
jgi:hypothetical protein